MACTFLFLETDESKSHSTKYGRFRHTTGSTPTKTGVSVDNAYTKKYWKTWGQILVFLFALIGIIIYVYTGYPFALAFFGVIELGLIVNLLTFGRYNYSWTLTRDGIFTSKESLGKWQISQELTLEGDVYISSCYIGAGEDGRQIAIVMTYFVGTDEFGIVLATSGVNEIESLFEALQKNLRLADPT